MKIPYLPTRQWVVLPSIPSTPPARVFVSSFSVSGNLPGQNVCSSQKPNSATAEAATRGAAVKTYRRCEVDTSWGSGNSWKCD